MRFEIIGSHVQRSNHVAARLGGACNSPLRLAGRGGRCHKLDWLHHLSDKPVGKQDNGIAIAIGKFKRKSRQVGHFLHGVGRKHDGAIVAVATTLYHLVIIALLRSDVAKARPAARDVSNDTWELGARHVADAFLHEADAGSARCCHAANSGRRSAVEHIDGGNFALRLQEDASDLRHVEGSGLGYLAGRRNWISVERPAPGQDRALHDCFVALHQLLAHASVPSSSSCMLHSAIGLRLTRRNTVIAPGSGQAMKQMPHPVHPAAAGRSPCDSRND